MYQSRKGPPHAIIRQSVNSEYMAHALKNINCFMSKARQALNGALVCLLLLSPTAYAFDLGHSRVTSAPGEPLVIDITLRNLSAADLSNLAVTLPSLQAWQAAGLTPPVALTQLQTRVLPGANDTTRLVRVSSSSASSETVINVLLDVSTGSANRIVQTSVIVLPPPSVNLPSGQTTTTMRGDTLIGIANQFPVSGANLYQRLWALYQANPAAFISNNMNLLKSGAALNIPDAQTVLAVDPGFAKAKYLEHVQAFQRMKSGGSAAPVGDQTASAAAEASDQNRGQVESASPEVDAPEQDQVRVSSEPLDVVADQQTSEARAIAEERARSETLQENVTALERAAEGSVKAAVDSITSTDASSAQSSTDVSENSAGTASQRAGDGDVSAGEGTDATGDGASLTTSSDAGDASSGDASGQAATTERSEVTETEAAAVSGSAPASDNVSGNASSASLSQDSASSRVDNASEPAQDAATQAVAWVKNNVAASIAIVLALAALILAWALRATSRSGDINASATAPEAAFKEKLAGIDLSLEPADAETQGGATSDGPGEPKSSHQPDAKSADAKKDNSA